MNQYIIVIVLAVSSAIWWVCHELYSDELSDDVVKLTTGPLAMASILVAIAILCLKNTAGNIHETCLDYRIVALVGFISVVAGALLVDSVMDKHLGLSAKKRIIFLNGGYLLFCLIMAIIACALVADALGNAKNVMEIRRIEPLFVAGALLFKVITLDEDRGIALLVLIFSSIYAWLNVYHLDSIQMSHHYLVILSLVGLIAVVIRFSMKKTIHGQ